MRLPKDEQAAAAHQIANSIALFVVMDSRGLRRAKARRDDVMVRCYRAERENTLRIIRLAVHGPYAAAVKHLLRENCRHWIAHFRRNPYP